MPEVRSADRFIEDDFKILRELDDRIAELIQERHQRIDMIREQHARNSSKLQDHEDWFEGSVRCNPVPDRGANVAYDMPTERAPYNGR